MERFREKIRLYFGNARNATVLINMHNNLRNNILSSIHILQEKLRIVDEEFERRLKELGGG